MRVLLSSTIMEHLKRSKRYIYMSLTGLSGALKIDHPDYLRLAKFHPPTPAASFPLCKDSARLAPMRLEELDYRSSLRADCTAASGSPRCLAPARISTARPESLRDRLFAELPTLLARRRTGGPQQRASDSRSPLRPTRWRAFRSSFSSYARRTPDRQSRSSADPADRSRRLGGAGSPGPKNAHR